MTVNNTGRSLAALFVLNALVANGAEAAATGSSVGANQISKEIDAKGLNELILKNRAGSAVVSSTTGAKAKVVAVKKRFSPTCKLTIERVGTRLIVENKQTGFVNSDDCEVQFQIDVPKLIQLDLSQGSGDLRVKEIDGALKFNLGSGQMKADGRFTKIDGHTGSGGAKIWGLEGGGSLATGSGDFDINFAKAPVSGALDINIASGNATVSFPKASRVHTEFTSVSGTLDNKLGDTADAGFRLSMKAASGNLTVKGY